MPTLERSELVRAVYRAFASGDRDVIERAFAKDLTFSSPVDARLDRAAYWEDEVTGVSLS